MHNRLPKVRPRTRNLACILDIRSFGRHTYTFATDQNAGYLQSLHKALKLLPNVNALLMDHHSEIDPNTLVHLTQLHAFPLLLSIDGCGIPLPTTFYSTPSLQKLAYLDISNIPGSISPLTANGIFPDLRILKLRGKEIDDAVLAALCNAYRCRLWSLDLSDNRITDKALVSLVNRCFPTFSLRSDKKFATEGALTNPHIGSEEYGLFYFIEESEWSYYYSHPHRYVMDNPTYAAEPYLLHQQRQVFRSDMREPPTLDTADAAAELLCHQTPKYQAYDRYRTAQGLTHLYLSRNHISAAGVEYLLRASSGQIERFECDCMPFLPPTAPYDNHWPETARLYGCVGAAYALRPVFSSNLRSVRIHHSIVTNIPTLELDGFSTLAKILLAEKYILPRVDLAYPEPFVPDMNPRIQSLTLTCVPRRSSGPLIERLVGFLRQLSMQERSIQDASKVASRRHSMLRGLRHVRLEFEPDPMEEGFSAADDLDAAELLNSGERGFSFFENEVQDKTVHQAKLKQPSKQAQADSSRGADTVVAAALQDPSSLGRDNKEFVSYHCEWNDKPFQVWVWAGAATAHTSSIVKNYRRLVVDENLRDGVGPATPEQVLAGAPEKALVFQTAWRITIMPRQLDAPPLAELAGMQDVLDALKSYRRAGREQFASFRKNHFASSSVSPPLGEPHYFWTGKLEVVSQEGMPHARPTAYWR